MMENTNKLGEIFYADVISSAGVSRITIPKQIIEGGNFKVGDKVKVNIIKLEKENNVNDEQSN